MTRKATIPMTRWRKKKMTGKKTSIEGDPGIVVGAFDESCLSSSLDEPMAVIP